MTWKSNYIHMNFVILLPIHVQISTAVEVRAWLERYLIAWARAQFYGSAEGPPRGVENRNLLSHPDDLRMEAYVIRMT